MPALRTVWRLIIPSASLFLTAALASCTAQTAAPLEQPATALPALAELSAYGPGGIRRVSDGNLALDPGPLAEAGSHNRAEGPGYVYAADEAELAWGLYSVALSAPEKPMSLLLDVSAAPLSTGGTDVQTHYWVGLANYTQGAWEWRGPYDADAEVVLNAAPGSPEPLKLDRYLSAAGLFSFVVICQPPAGSGPAAVRLDAANLLTSDNYQPYRPHYVQLDDLSADVSGLSLSWTEVGPLDPGDTVNLATQYLVFRRGPLDLDYLQVGTVAAPAGGFADPAQSAAAAAPLLRGAEYSYYVIASNAVGQTYSSAKLSAVYPVDVSQLAWSQSQADYARTSYVPAASFTGQFVAGPATPFDEPASSTLRREPVVSLDGWLALVTKDAVDRFSLTDGSLLSSAGSFFFDWHSSPSLQGDLLVYQDETNGVNRINATIPAAPLQNFSGPGRTSAAPLQLGQHLLWVDENGIITLFDTGAGSVQWQHGSNPSGPYSLAPATDMQYVYAIKDNGFAEKLELRSGKRAASLDLGATPIGLGLVLDSARQRLFVPSYDHALHVLSTLDLSEETVIDYPQGGGAACAPALLWNASPPLLVYAYSYTAPVGGARYTALRALNAETLQEEWLTQVPEYMPEYVSACADHIFVVKKSNSGGETTDVAIFDLDGNLAQTLSFDSALRAPVVPCGNKLAVVQGPGTSADSQLQFFETEAVAPPTWQDEVGLFNWLPEGQDGTFLNIAPRWDYAIHPDGLPVKYVLFYAAGHAPMLDAPYTDTTVIPDLTIQDGDGSNQFRVTGVLEGVRYYAAVRAYVGNWGSGAVTDGNSVILACTPPWLEKVVFSGSSLVGDGDTLAMAGMRVDLRDSGRPILMCNEINAGELWCYYAFSNDWGKEGIYLNALDSDGFDSDWLEPNYFVANAKSGQLRVLKRNAADDWSNVIVAGCEPDVNPALSLRMGSQSALAFTEFVGGGAPTTEVDYLVTRHNGVSWQAPETLDGNNLGGRDIALTLDPADPARPWIAYQLGTTAATGLAACTKGELWYARGDGAGGYVKELVDAGDNAPDSDCGKRVVQILDGDGRPCLAYLDLNASATEPRGQLKYAHYNGSGWDVETVRSIDLSAQSGENQHTYARLGLALNHLGQPTIAFLERQGYNTDLASPYLVDCWIYTQAAPDNWTSELIAEGRPVKLKDREPCDLVLDGDNNLHCFFVSGPPSDLDLCGRQIMDYRRMTFIP
jgi:hypothetical protein